MKKLKRYSLIYVTFIYHGRMQRRHAHIHFWEGTSADLAHMVPLTRQDMTKGENSFNIIVVLSRSTWCVGLLLEVLFSVQDASGSNSELMCIYVNKSSKIVSDQSSFDILKIHSVPQRKRWHDTQFNLPNLDMNVWFLPHFLFILLLNIIVLPCSYR